MADTSDDELLQIDNRKETHLLQMATASDFQRLCNGISTNLTKINTNTSDFEKLVQKLGTPDDSEPLRQRYLRIQTETKSLMQQTNNDLAQLQKTVVGTTPDQRQKKTSIENLAKQYLPIMNRFQEAQRLGARKEKESLERARAASYRGQDDPFAADNGIFSSLTPPPQQQQQQQQIASTYEQDVTLQGIVERGTQLHQVEQNIVELNEIFKEVSRIVLEHGDIIDTIEKHTEDTERNVTVANSQLGKAVSYQSGARRKKILIITILIIVLIIVGIGLYFGLRK